MSTLSSQAETGTAIPIQDGPVDCTPRLAGFDPRRLEVLDRHFLGMIEKNRLQGAGYILSRGGRVFAHRAMGWLQAEKTGSALGTESLRTIASITKMFTSVAVMQLVEMGKLAIETPVSSLIPEFMTGEHWPIQVRHLLTHSSGIYFDPGSMCEPYPRDWIGIKDKEPSLSDEEKRSFWYKTMLQGIPYREPGREWMYCSAGFTVLADLVFRLTGTPYTTWVSDHILKPLGMNDSSFWLDPAQKDRLCNTRDEFPEWVFQEKSGHIPKAGYGGGGLISTLADMWRFGQALCSGGSLQNCPSSLVDHQTRLHSRILGKRTVEFMAMNHLENCKSRAWGNVVAEYRYGLGFVLPMDSLWSPGSFGHEGAGRCVLMVDPAEEFVAMYFVPSRLDWVGESVKNTQQIICSGLL